MTWLPLQSGVAVFLQLLFAKPSLYVETVYLSLFWKYLI